MKNVLVIGSANMDYTVYVSSFPLEGETIFGSSRFIQPGGKGENQAVAIAKANKTNVSFIAAIGKDADGEQIKEVLKEYNVDAHLIELDDVETGNATIVVNENSENEIVVVKGANGKIKSSDIDLSLIDKCDYVVLQNEIPEEVNKYVILEAKKRNKIVIYNPAPFRPVEDDIWPLIDYFVPNKVELFRYTNEQDYIQGAKKLLSKNVKNVIVTIGKEGSVLINNDKVIKVNAYLVDAVDTVAAGDTYVGYFVSSLASGYEIKEAMEYASKASSITVSRKGSVVSIPFGNEVYE